jgi:hypothetical protein
MNEKQLNLRLPESEMEILNRYAKKVGTGLPILK